MKKVFISLLFILLALGACNAYAVTKIYTRDDLAAIVNNPADDYVLCADIDLSGEAWTPIPSLEGTFDGGNHVIRNLTIQGTYDNSTVGLFSLIAGTVTNLNLEDIRFEVHCAGKLCTVSPFGMAFRYESSPLKLPSPKIMNCTVSGEINVTAEDNCRTNVYGLFMASGSTENLNISASCGSLYITGLSHCTHCTGCGDIYGVFEGTPDQPRLNGIVIENCIDCTADFNVRLDSNGGKPSSLLTGISSNTKYARGCTLSGSLFSDGSVTVISGRNGNPGCESYADVTSDNIIGLNQCVECRLHGSLRFRGINDYPRVSFINDCALDSLTYQDPKYTKNGNTCDCVFEIGEDPEKIIKTVGINAFLYEGSRLDTPLALENMGDAKVIIKLESPSPSGQYRNGDISVSTTTGDIYINSTLATWADTTATSDSGAIRMVASSYNGGNVYAYSTGLINVIGGEVYNQGNVTAIADSQSSVTVSGTSSSGSFNEGAVSGTNYGNGSVSVYGAKGSHSVNTGLITANGSVGTVYAIGTDSNDSINYGDIQANGEETVYAFGAKGGINTGNVSAVSNGSTGYVYAEAKAGGGSAYAEGLFARSYGAQSTARSTEISETAYNGHFVWKLTSHYHSWDGEWANCNVLEHIITDVDQYSVDAHDYQLCAAAYLDEVNGALPDLPEIGMPEMEEAASDVSVIAHLYSLQTDKEITGFQNTFGSFSWNDGLDDAGNRLDDFSKMELFLQLTSKADAPRDISFNLRLPDGFSFSPEFIQRELDEPIQCTLSPNTPYFVNQYIYPMYSEETTRTAAFELVGDIEETLYYPVSKNLEEGLIYMRPTSEVNQMDSSPLVEVVHLNPVADFIDTATDAYSDTLATLGCCISQAVYNENRAESSDESYIRTSLHNLGFSRIKWYGNKSDSRLDDPHDVAVAFATKTVVSGDNVRDILMVAVRGTVDLEWIGNFNAIGPDSDFHADFRLCADKVIERMQTYIDDMGLHNDRTRAYICGHSRAGAVVDLFAHDLNLGRPSLVSELTAYTFAAPNSTKIPSIDGNIFNYIYKYDIVPHVPHGDFRKNGINIVVGGNEKNNAPDSVKDAFRYYTRGHEYEDVGVPFPIELLYASDEIETLFNYVTLGQSVIGHLWLMFPPTDSSIARAHGAENYLSWVTQNRSENAITMEAFEGEVNSKWTTRALKLRIQFEKQTTLKPFIMASHCFQTFMKFLDWARMFPDGASTYGIGCPINVEIQDAEGNVMGQLTEHSIGYLDDGAITFGDGEHSYVIIPAGSEYRLVITGTDDGEMSLAYVFIDNEWEWLDAKAIEMPVATGETYTIMDVSEPGRNPSFDVAEIRFDDPMCYDYTVEFPIIEDQDKDSHDGWVLDYAIADYDTLCEAYGEAEWNVEIVEGNEDVEAYMITDEAVGVRKACLWIENTPRERGETMLHVTASLASGPSVSGNVRIKWVLPEDKYLPQAFFDEAYDIDMILPLEAPEDYNFWEGEGEVLYIWYDQMDFLTQRFGQDYDWTFDVINGPVPELRWVRRDDGFQFYIDNLNQMPEHETSDILATLHCGDYSASTVLHLHYQKLELPESILWETDVTMAAGETRDIHVDINPFEWYDKYFLYCDHTAAFFDGWNEEDNKDTFYIAAKAPGTYELWPHLHIGANAFIFGPKISVHVVDKSGDAKGTLIIPNAMSSIENEAFYGTEAELLILPEGVNIGSKAFAYMPNLKRVLLGYQVGDMAEDAFLGDEDICFYCPYDSDASQWATEHGYSFIEY